ncbi:MAG: precorrin-6A reductase [Clostridiales bacterium]|nr:precorrin-6A reductase [Clostridiales bacterium]
MIRVVIFGGTAEGRELSELCSTLSLSFVYCVATQDGALQVEALPGVDVRVGRLRAAQMAELLSSYEPELAIDATHPYAKEASQNISSACQSANVPLLRVIRENSVEEGCIYFESMDDLIAWLEQRTGNIFVTMGSSSASAFTKLTDYQKRVWLRILPGIESLSSCLDFGYHPERLICMQGPFSEEINSAMFKAADAKFLVTKNTGAAGGFMEKVRAAKKLGLITAVMSRPEEADGVSLEEAKKRLWELHL